MKESEAFFAMMGCAFSAITFLGANSADGDLFMQLLCVIVAAAYTMFAIRFLGRWLILVGERMQKPR